MSTYTLELSDAEHGRYRRMAELARDTEADLWEQAGIRPGARVADVGCGPGAVLAVMAERVGPDGHVSGVDGSADAVVAAEAVVAQLPNADVRRRQATDTGLEPGSFDVAVLRHVLAHNGGAEQAIVDHLATLVRPSGAVYVVDVDLTALRIHPIPPELEDLNDAYVEFHRRRGNDPQVGLRLDELLAAAGLRVEAYRGWFAISEAPPGMRSPAWAARDAMVASGVVTEDDVARWGAAMGRLDQETRRPRIFPAVFAAVGRSPQTA